MNIFKIKYHFYVLEMNQNLMPLRGKVENIKLSKIGFSEETADEYLNAMTPQEFNMWTNQNSRRVRYEEHFHVAAQDIPEANWIAIHYLNANMDEAPATIDEIKLMKIDLINYPDDSEFECDCPYCSASVEDVAPEDVMTFRCLECDSELSVTDGWKVIQCKKCGVPIYRDQVIGHMGKYTLVKHIEEYGNEDFDEDDNEDEEN